MAAKKAYAKGARVRWGGGLQMRVCRDIKVVIIGESGVGKTAIMQRFVENKFNKTVQTLGVSFVVKEHRGLHMAIWVSIARATSCAY